MSHDDGVQRYVLIIERLLVGVLAIAPVYGFTPIEKDQNESANCVEYDHQYKD